MDKKTALLIELDDDNREDVFELALSTYLGKTCKFCGIEFDTLESLKGVVYAGSHEGGRLAHRKCWNDNAY